MGHQRARYSALAAVLGLVAVHLSCVAAADNAAQDVTAVTTAALRFIESKRDFEYMTWKPKETAAAILALTSVDPTWSKTGKSSTIKRLEIAVVLQNMKLALLELLTSGPGISGIDHSTLAQFIGALQVTCSDPTNFMGRFDLVAEAKRRLETIPRFSPAYGGLVLALCNSGVEISKEQIARMAHRNRTSGEQECQFCLERSSLNVLALSCLFKDQEKYHARTVFATLVTNVNYLNSLKPTAEGFGNLFSTSLALQAQQVSPHPITFDRQSVIKHVTSLQQADGSFGGSVVFTAIVLPAFSQYTAVDIRTIECTSKAKGSSHADNVVLINYEIAEDVFSSQTVVGDFLATRGKSLFDGLKEYQTKYPEVFSFDTFSTSFGLGIRRINDIENNDRQRLYWKVFKASGGGKEEPVDDDLKNVQYAEGDTFIFRYQNLAGA